MVSRLENMRELTFENMREFSNDMPHVVANRELNIIVVLSFVAYLIVARAANQGSAIAKYTTNKAISDR